MRQRLAWLAGAAVGVAIGALIGRRWRGREAVVDSRAAELRQKLAAARAPGDVGEAVEPALAGEGGAAEPWGVGEGPPTTPPPTGPEEETGAAKTDASVEGEDGDEIETARGRIHEEGRSLADEMRRAGGEPS